MRLFLSSIDDNCKILRHIQEKMVQGGLFLIKFRGHNLKTRMMSNGTCISLRSNSKNNPDSHLSTCCHGR